MKASVRVLDQDRINTVDPVMTGRSSMAVIDALQDYDPEVQIVGAAAVFLLLCQRFKQHPGNVFATCQRVMDGVDGKRWEFEAVESYLAEEV